jgi:hypothetical protein
MLVSRKIIRTRLHFWITGRTIDEWARQTGIFFVLAIGRSGTHFLSDLLNKVPGTCIFHEPVREDFAAYVRAFHSGEEAKGYVHTFRKKEIYLRARAMHLGTYGEVNSLLRRHAYALQEAFPGAAFVHLVRDGRDIVRSMMARKTMTPEDRFTVAIQPHAEDQWRDKWAQMDRFARLCWYWQVENAYLRTAIGRTVQFERLVSSYEYLSEHLLQVCGLDLPEQEWQRAIAAPKNVTLKHRIPAWQGWSAEQKQTFKEICGEEMERNGYVL